MEDGLRYVTDQTPGIRRVRSGRGFRYVGPGGQPVRDPETLARIRGLAVPPAWKDVWISRDPRGHLQATGRDARGRKQYRYHQRWREHRERTKYDRLIAFAEALPAIRSRVRRDLAAPGLPREKVLAVVVRLLDLTGMRVGNREYARDNGSFGLTTLHNRHVRVNGSGLLLSFRGKSGKRHEVEVNNPRIARIVRRCRDIPGQRLFQYRDEHGRYRAVGSSDVNAYLRDASGEDFTAKDFRTWQGTVLAVAQLKKLGAPGSKRQARGRLVRAVEAVASELGNTPAVCRSSYLHPEVIAGYEEGALSRFLERRKTARPGRLRVTEAETLGYLRSRLRRTDHARAA